MLKRQKIKKQGHFVIQVVIILCIMVLFSRFTYFWKHFYLKSRQIYKIKYAYKPENKKRSLCYENSYYCVKMVSELRLGPKKFD